MEVFEVCKNGLSPPIEGRLHTLWVVTDFKSVHEQVNFYFHSASMFVKYHGLEIRNWIKVIFLLCMKRAIENCAKILL